MPQPDSPVFCVTNRNLSHKNISCYLLLANIILPCKGDNYSRVLPLWLTSERRSPGLVHWIIGSSVHRFIGSLDHWITGSLDHRGRGKRVNPNIRTSGVLSAPRTRRVTLTGCPFGLEYVLLLFFGPILPAFKGLPDGFVMILVGYAVRPTDAAVGKLFTFPPIRV